MGIEFRNGIRHMCLSHACMICEHGAKREQTAVVLISNESCLCMYEQGRSRRLVFGDGRRTGSLEDAADGAIVVDTPDGLPEEIGDGEDGELGEALVLHHGHGVGDDHLLKEAAGEPLHSGRAENGMGAAGVDSSSSLLVQKLRALGDGSCCVDHVVHHDSNFSSDIANQMHHLGLVVSVPALIDDGQGRIRELLGEGARPGHSSHVRRHHHHLVGADGLAGQVVQDDRLAVDMVDGDVEIADGLARVDVARQHAVGAGLRDEVGHQLCGDGLAALHLPVGPGVAEVGDHGGDVLGGGPPAGVDHDEELHEILVGRRARRLHQEHVAAAHALLQLHVDLAIREPLDLDLAQLHPQVASHLLRQSRVGAAGEDAQAAAAAARLDWQLQRRQGGHRGSRVVVLVHAAATPQPHLMPLRYVGIMASRTMGKGGRKRR
uniref:Uncharacterized protein n=1 Tax=Arundo donax TaxID=35708 RepID=A0A0A9GRQ3_ARUDO